MAQITRSRFCTSAVVASLPLLTGLWRLGHQSLWLDESVSVRVAGLDPMSLLRRLMTSEVFNALYYTFLHVWERFGNTEVWVRIPSVAFGVAAVVTLFALNAHLFGQRIAVTAAVLLSVNAFFVRYMQEARAYALVVLAVVAASYCFVSALERPSWQRWFVYGVASAVAIYAHLYAGFVIAGHLFALGWRGRRPPLRYVGIAYIVTGALVTPLLIVMIGSDSLERNFIPGPSINAIESLFLHLSGGGGVASRESKLLLLLYFAACCGALWGVVRVALKQRKRCTDATWSCIFVLLWLAVPVVTTFAISFVRPMFYPRYLIVVLPALVTAAAIGISRLPYALLRAVTIGMLVVLSLPALRAYYGTSIREGGDWRAATAYVAREERRGDGIVFLSRYGRAPFEYYSNIPTTDAGLMPVYPGEALDGSARFLGYLESESNVGVAERLDSVTRTWAFLSWRGFDSRADDGAPIRRALEGGFTETSRREFGPSLEVRLYERREQRHLPTTVNPSPIVTTAKLAGHDTAP